MGRGDGWVRASDGTTYVTGREGALLLPFPCCSCSARLQGLGLG